MSSTPVVLSIDWDFFIWNPGEVPDAQIKIHPGTDREQIVPASELFNWGHNENWSSALHFFVWETRLAAFQSYGLEIEAEYAIRVEKGCVDPADFCKQICGRYKFSDTQFLEIADSHQHGLLCVRKAAEQEGRAVKVSLFDAHADLGYSENMIARQIKSGNYDAASWLFHCLRLGFTDYVEIIYPDWKGTSEWELGKGYGYLEPYRESIDVMTYSEWLSRSEGGVVVMANTARSSSWTPPWLDVRFNEFVDRLPATVRVCLDCKEEADGDYNACQPRKWNSQEVRKSALYLAEKLRK